MFINFAKRYFKLVKFKISWRLKNRHNFTGAENVYDDKCVSVGNYTYGRIKVLSEPIGISLKIGSYCSIADDVAFILGNEHPLNRISTYPYKHMLVDSGLSDAISKGNIIVDDDVWIGYRAVIMSGVHIGQGAVVAAGAVVTKDVPPYSIVGGVPAKVIKYRFSADVINELLKIDYSMLSDEMVRKHIDDLYTELKDVKQLGWMPKRD